MVTRQDFRKARLYEQMVGSASVNVIVFTQLNPACIWLGVDMKEAQAWISSKRAAFLPASTDCLYSGPFKNASSGIFPVIFS